MATQISDENDLQNMNLDLTDDYELVANIDCSTIANFQPVGGWGGANAFTGSFDGKGFRIINLVVNRAADDYIGLFGEIDGASIKNVHIEATLTGDDYVGIIGKSTDSTVDLVSATVTIIGDQNVGGLVGLDDGSAFTNCSTSGLVDGNKYVGGLIGALTYGAWSIDTCKTSVAVTASADGPQEIGGLIGYAPAAIPTWTGTIDRSYATGSVTVTRTAAGAGTVRYIGGLIGRGGPTLNACYATGTVSIINNSADATGDALEIGGLIGFYWGNASDCYSLVDISISKVGAADWDALELGGFVGEYDYGLVAGDAVTANSYYAGTITIADVAGAQTVGGFCANATGGGTIQDTNCFWDTVTSGQAASDGGTGKTTAQMQDIETFSAAGWAVSRIWSLLETCNNGYPCLISVNPCCPPTLLPPLDPTIAPKKVSLEHIRNLEIMNGARSFIGRDGNFTWESRFHRG